MPIIFEDIRKLSLTNSLAEDLIASFDALTAAIKDLEHKTFFLELLEESKKLAIELFAASRINNTYILKDAGLKNDIRLLTKSNNITANILKHQHIDLTEYNECLATLDLTIADCQNQFTAQFQASEKRWKAVKMGLIVFGLIIAFAGALTLSILTLPPFITVVFAVLTVGTIGLAIHAACMCRTGADMIDAAMANVAVKEKKDSNSKDLKNNFFYNEKLNLFKKTDKTYRAHIETKKYIQKYSPAWIRS